MRKNRGNNIAKVTFSYVGTEKDFLEFLKILVHDYLAVDHPYIDRRSDFVDKVDSCCA